MRSSIFQYFIIILIILVNGCKRADSDNSETNSIDSSFNKTLHLNQMFVNSTVDYTLNELESVEKWKNNQLVSELKYNKERYCILDRKIDSIKLQLKINKIEINSINSSINEIINIYLNASYSAIYNYVFKKRDVYKDAKNEFEQLLLKYKNKKDFIKENKTIPENCLGITKLKADLLGVYFKVNNILSNNFQTENFIKPPGEFYIFDNQDLIKVGEKYTAKIIYASNFIISMEKHIKEIKVTEIKLDNSSEKVNIDCKLKNDIIEFDYYPQKKGKYLFTGYILFDQGEYSDGKIFFEKDFIIK